jgi:3-deoxy-D-manno-octulosonic-acid transferase
VFILYNFLLTILAPLWVPWMLVRAKSRKEAPNWAERQGNYNLSRRPDNKRIWLHAVSVGEVVAAMPILRELRNTVPDYEIVLSVTTSSGHRTAREQTAGLYDHLVYFPIDIARFQLSAMQRVQPAVVAIMETELWMNFLWAAKVFEARTLLINGRISDRSFPRSKSLKFFYKALLKNMDRCLMQTEKDAERIKILGAKSAEVFGNCKFDQAVEGLDADPVAWRTDLGLDPTKPVVVIGSTRGDDEEDLVLEAIKAVGLDKCSVIHAPRHLERVPEISQKVRAELGDCGLRSRGEHSRYMLLDTYGELAKVYSVADVVVIGGGFSNQGGQNLLQPLAHGKPVLHGPHMQNFREVAEAARDAGASLECATPTELADAITRLLGDPSERARMGAAASTLVNSNLGASRRYAEAIAQAAADFQSAQPGP